MNLNSMGHLQWEFTLKISHDIYDENESIYTSSQNHGSQKLVYLQKLPFKY